MSWQATAWAMEQRVGEPASKLLLLALANYADEYGACWPSIKTLAWDTEISERSVQYKIAGLMEAGLIEVTPRKDPETGYQRSNFVLLNLRGEGCKSCTPPVQQGAPPPVQLVAPHIEEPPLRTTNRTTRKKEIVLDSSPSAQIPDQPKPFKPIPSDRDFGDRLVITEFDLITADGSTVVTAEHFKELEAKYPLIKNMRGMVHSAFRTWLADAPPKNKMFALETWLGRLSAEAVAKDKKKPKPAAKSSDAYQEPDDGWRERKAKNKKIQELKDRHLANALAREAANAGPSG